jgi:hypothetical protein
MKDFEIYSYGLIYCSVCTSWKDIQKITDQVNKEYPTGLSSKRTLADEPFRGGAANPHPCETMGGTHNHYLFVC